MSWFLFEKWMHFFHASSSEKIVKYPFVVFGLIIFVLPWLFWLITGTSFPKLVEYILFFDLMAILVNLFFPLKA